MHIYLARFFERHSSKVVWRRELPEYTRDNQINGICLRTFIIHWLQFQARNWMHNSLASRSMYNNKSSIFQCYFLLSVNVWRIKVFSLGIDIKNEEIKFLSFFGTFFYLFRFPRNVSTWNDSFVYFWHRKIGTKESLICSYWPLRTARRSTAKKTCKIWTKSQGKKVGIFEHETRDLFYSIPFN